MGRPSSCCSAIRPIRRRRRRGSARCPGRPPAAFSSFSRSDRRSDMRRAILISMLLASLLPGAVVLDRVAVVVGKRAIKLSDIERDIRVTAFLTHATVDTSAAARCKSAERLVDQTVIRDEIATGDYERATDADAVG